MEASVLEKFNPTLHVIYKRMKVLVTGAAGFIGMHVALSLLKSGDVVVGIDNINTYYDVNLKLSRLKLLHEQPNFKFIRLQIEDEEALHRLFAEEQPERVVHLAAQAGVRYSLKHPRAYVDSNLHGFLNVLESCRKCPVEHLVFASSSSVYGGNTNMPFSELHNVDHPVSLYAATKKANELMAHSYSHLFGIPATGLRFFTVYGPWGRPDMAPFLFTSAILKGEPINVFNHGDMARDFTYIDDITEGVVRVLNKPATPDPNFNSSSPNPAASNAPFRIFNIGNSRPTPLLDFIAGIEKATGIRATKNFLPMQMGDVAVTSACTDRLEEWVGFTPKVSIDDGIARFYDWYRSYYAAQQ